MNGKYFQKYYRLSEEISLTQKIFILKHYIQTFLKNLKKHNNDEGNVSNATLFNSSKSYSKDRNFMKNLERKVHRLFYQKQAPLCCSEKLILYLSISLILKIEALFFIRHKCKIFVIVHNSRFQFCTSTFYVSVFFSLSFFFFDQDFIFLFIIR